jgi:hypothetical protein
MDLHLLVSSAVDDLELDLVSVAALAGELVGSR